MLKLRTLTDAWMYIHIPKNSGTNFKRTVYAQYEGNYSRGYTNDVVETVWPELWQQYADKNLIDKNLIGDSIGDEIISKIFLNFSENQLQLKNQVQHSPLHIWQKCGLYDNEKVITIARNPYTRFISHYNATLRTLGAYFEFKFPSPTEFIAHKKLNFLAKLDPCNYLINQIDYIKDINGQVKCDRIYKMETDLENLRQDFNLQDINANHNRANYNRNYANLYTDELIEFVQKTYKRDFEYFEYDINPFW
jgi:hypothetical protein